MKAWIIKDDDGLYYLAGTATTEDGAWWALEQWARKCMDVDKDGEWKKGFCAVRVTIEEDKT